jgi:hypothetical protein
VFFIVLAVVLVKTLRSLYQKSLDAHRVTQKVTTRRHIPIRFYPTHADYIQPDALLDPSKV